MDFFSTLKLVDMSDDHYERLNVPISIGENHPNWGRKAPPEWKEQHSKDVTEWWAQFTPEERSKLAGTNKGKFWITNGTESKMIAGEIPDGWKKGRHDTLSKQGRKKLSQSTTKRNTTNKPANKGKFWITNGTENKMIRGEIPEGWTKGRPLKASS